METSELTKESVHLQIVSHNKPVECVDDEGHQLGNLSL